MGTSSPRDLVTFRSRAERITGITDPDAIGIAGDRRHQVTGGYHLGRTDLQAIGRYHEPAGQHVGSPDEDYSARYARDRNGLTDDASAVDVDEAWPNGGRAAWIRWNNLVVGELRAGRWPLAAAVRAVNTTLDGVNDRRFDGTNAWTAESTSDHGHTHFEFWRDTAGNRDTALVHLTDLMTIAIQGGPVSTHTIDDVFDLIAGIVDGLPKPDGVPSAVPDWVHAAATHADVVNLTAAVNNLTTNVTQEFLALQQNPAVMPTAAAIAGEIIKQLGLSPK